MSSSPWADPATGLASGPIDEPEYPLRCRHCPDDIRGLNGFYENRAGFTRCAKGVDHEPMPCKWPRESRQQGGMGE